MSQSYDVIVIGAGIMGASTAYHLKKSGVGKVLLFERRAPAAGGTGLTAGVIRQHYSTTIASRLTKESIGLFKAVPEEIGVDGGFVQSGWIFLVPDDLLDGARKNVEMQKSIGIDTRFLDETEITERFPWLNPEGVGAVIYERDGGYADGVRATEAFVKGFKDLGGEARLQTPVRELRRDGDRVTGVVTDDGFIAAGAVVNAAGPWSKFLAASVGIDMDMRVVREQDTVWQARDDRPIPEVSISNAVDAIYIRPLGDRRYVVGRGFPKEYFDVDAYNYKETADEEFVSDVLTRLQHRILSFAGVTRIDSYSALYDVMPDWYPVVGPRQGLDGYFEACGGSGHGFKLGPAIGLHLARWIVDGAIDEEFAQLSYDRFAAGKPFVGAFGGNRG